MANNEINVLKRNGRGKEPLNIDKIHSMVGYATQEITGVSASHVEMNSGIQFADGMSTDDIQQILIKSANDLISFRKFLTINMLLLDYYYSPFVKNYIIRLWEHPKFIDQIKLVSNKVYMIKTY